MSDWTYGLDGWATGWGVSYPDGSSSNDLNQLQIQIMTNTECESNYLYFNAVTQLCTIGVNQGICIGDSGKLIFLIFRINF